MFMVMWAADHRSLAVAVAPALLPGCHTAEPHEAQATVICKCRGNDAKAVVKYCHPAVTWRWSFSPLPDLTTREPQTVKTVCKCQLTRACQEMFRMGTSETTITGHVTKWKLNYEIFGYGFVLCSHLICKFLLSL